MEIAAIAMLILVKLNTACATDSPYYCSSNDPCSDANLTSLFEPYTRYEMCLYEQKNEFCDRYITPQWYRADEPMLNHCPRLLSCGALYPLWLNDSLPSESDGIVTRPVCKVGFSNCCVKEYTIQIRHCGSFYAYCLAALDGCPERYCFGVNGSCDIPTTQQQTSTGKTEPFPTYPCLKGHYCHEDFSKKKTMINIALVVASGVLITVLGILVVWYLHVRRKEKERKIQSEKKIYPGFRDLGKTHQVFKMPMEGSMNVQPSRPPPYTAWESTKY